MLPTQLDSVDESHLNALVSNGVPESRSLEFKAKLVWGTESERKEFLADIIHAVDDYIKFYRKYEMPTPVLVDVKGFRMGSE